MTKRPGRIALGGLLLAGLGYVVGILTAPKSGKETRKDIQSAAVKAKLEAEKDLKNAHAELTKLVNQTKSKAEGATTKAKNEVTKAVDLGQAAKDKVRVMLSAIHEGDSDNKDLQKALNEANKAISHLKNFITSNAKAK